MLTAFSFQKYFLAAMNAAFQRLYPVPDEPLTLEHVVQFTGVAIVVIAFAFVLRYVFIWFFPK